MIDRQKVQVLLVEDDEDDYVITRELLAESVQTHFTLEWVTTYEAALAAIDRQVHTVGLVDFRLGAHTGVDLLHAANARGCTIPMILLTGQGDHALDIEVMKAGAADYLVKGQINGPLLERAIRYALERKQAHNNLMDVLQRLDGYSKALEAKTREQETFIYTVAHDLKAPLVSLQGMATLLSEDYATRLDDDARLYIARIMANTQKMHLLLDDLLELARVGRVDVELELIDLNYVFDSVVEQLHQTLTTRGAIVVRTSELPTIHANTTRMHQVFTNLIANAVHYTPLDRLPHVEVAAVEQQHCWEVLVGDNGVGMPIAAQTKIFNLFQRLPTGKALNPLGTGVGLAIVARIVELHAGKLWFDSQEGVGTTFHIALPKVPPAGQLLLPVC